MNDHLESETYFVLEGKYGFRWVRWNGKYQTYDEALEVANSVYGDAGPIRILQITEAPVLVNMLSAS